MKLLNKILFVILLSWAQILCAQEGTLKWKYNLGDYFINSPAIGQNSTIYISPYSYVKFIAFYPNSTIQWMIDTSGSYYETSPMVGPDGTIYLNFGPSMQAYNPNGTLQWSTTIYYSLNFIYGNTFGLGPDGTLYLAGDGGLCAFTPQGVQKWEYKISDLAGGVAVNHRDGMIYTVSNITSFYAIYPNGTLAWTISTTVGYDRISLDSQGNIYVGSGNNLYCLNPNGSIQWNFLTNGEVSSQAVFGEDGAIYFGSADGYLYALNPNGMLKWRYLTGGPIYGGRAIGNDGVIYFGSYDGYIYALNPDGTLRWRYQTGYTVGSCPAIGSDGTLYIGSWDNNFYALYCSSTGLANSPWPRGGHDNQNTNLSSLPPTSAPLFPDELYP